MRKITALFSLLFLCTFFMITHAQIKGIVTDSKSGSPLEGVLIKVKQANIGTNTNSDGNFELNAKVGTPLQISLTGYASKEVKAEASFMSINLVQDVKGLSEVVVTALGVRRNEKSLGYSISKVNPSELLQKSEPDLLKNLQGQVAGVDIRTSQGTPGAATLIQIRGNSSITSGSQPLFVVDGVPYSNITVATSSQTSGGTAYGSGISDLDPNDIASINVLKGAAAAALYGSRGSNGVVLITTKTGAGYRGKKAVNFTYRSGASIEQVANLPSFQNSYGAGSQLNYSNSNGSWGPKFGTLDSISVWPEYYAAYPNLFPSSKRIAYQAYPNNVKDLFKTGFELENSFGINGGNENTTLSALLSNVTNQGYITNAKYIRNNLSLGAQTKLKYGINFGGNLAYTNSKQTGGFFGENQVDGAASQFA